MEKLFVHIIKVSENKFEIAGLSENKDMWCQLPAECRELKHHPTLANKSVIKNAISVIKPIRGYRRVAVKLDEQLKNEYFDEDENLSYKNLPLEEIVNDEVEHLTSTNNRTEEEGFFIQRIKELERQLNLNNDNEVSLHQVEKKFILDKFDRKPNPVEWLLRFENECERNKIPEGPKRIEALRFFLMGSPKDWYETTLKKLGLMNWPEWRRSFLAVFVEKGWSMVRKAFSFRYLAGSLIDYALVKERLLMDIDPHGLELSRINVIVIGLPIEIQEEIDREEVNTIEKLLNELRKLEDMFNKKKKRENTVIKTLNPEQQNLSTPSRMKQNSSTKLKDANNVDIKLKLNESNTIRKPCSICESLGWPNRWHPINECRNKDKYEAKIKCNITEQIIEDEDASVMKIMSEN